MFLRFVRNKGVRQYAGAVDEAAHRAVFRADGAQHLRHSLGVAHVHGIVNGPSAGRFYAIQCLACFALGGEFAVAFADNSWRGVIVEMQTERPLDLGLDRERRQPIGFALRRRAAAK